MTLIMRIALSATLANCKVFILSLFFSLVYYLIYLLEFFLIVFFRILMTFFMAFFVTFFLFFFKRILRSVLFLFLNIFLLIHHNNFFFQRIEIFFLFIINESFFSQKLLRSKVRFKWLIEVNDWTLNLFSLLLLVPLFVVLCVFIVLIASLLRFELLVALLFVLFFVLILITRFLSRTFLMLSFRDRQSIFFFNFLFAVIVIDAIVMNLALIRGFSFDFSRVIFLSFFRIAED